MSENLRDTPAAEKSAFLAVNGGAGLDRGGGAIIASTNGRIIQLQYGRWAPQEINF